MAEPCAPGSAARGVELHCSPAAVRAGLVEPGSVLEVATSEVVGPVLSAEIVVVGMAERVSAPGMVSTERVVSDSVWGNLEVVLETGVLVSGG